MQWHLESPASEFYSGTDERKHQSSASLAFVRGIHRSHVNSPHKWPVMRKMFQLNDGIMVMAQCSQHTNHTGGWLVTSYWHTCDPRPITTWHPFYWTVMLSILNSLWAGRSECDSQNVIFNLVLLIGIFRSTHDNAISWLPQDLTDDKLTLVQVMAWCCQATRHYLNQCWLSSLWPYDITRPQWVKGNGGVAIIEIYNFSQKSVGTNVKEIYPIWNRFSHHMEEIHFMIWRLISHHWSI